MRGNHAVRKQMAPRKKRPHAEDSGRGL